MKVAVWLVLIVLFVAGIIVLASGVSNVVGLVLIAIPGVIAMFTRGGMAGAAGTDA